MNLSRESMYPSNEYSIILSYLLKRRNELVCWGDAISNGRGEILLSLLPVHQPIPTVSRRQCTQWTGSNVFSYSPWSVRTIPR